ncbi:hypothetical protein MWU65_14340 [Cellulophaga sp. F20128]|uniref:hypothetical protein n=1 Tax=Cellulophaga sp. F20128 TaxID=2926413 RepID=UPI001FF2B041|nr:hypothetical protein [Cellulophaga sp. F20128]MCK0158371.1 hypothetical protein [Cellulophaga sp. F20128]
MDEQKIYTDRFVRKTLKNVDVEKPSVDFTSTIMSQITVAKQSEVTRYSALISKQAWVVIFIVTCSICVYFSVFYSEEKASWMPQLDYSLFTDLNLFSGLSMSSSVVYGIMALAVMTIVQVPIYVNYYNKRLKM